ncbi:M48 family metalloprotease [Magnetovibrio sp.]|uniref:M48 family metalloprotease n=1 Tax=Magnetovibrio sp. TaxID=2024836 RepID=UPI002F937B50
MVLNVLKRLLTPVSFVILFRRKAVSQGVQRVDRFHSPMRRLCSVALIVALAWMMPNSTAFAQGGQTIIRDAEIEGIIRAYSTPLFVAAGLDPKSVNIRLIQDSTLNAFVAGGRNIFIHTGLLLASKDPNALIGVIAHETGHIEGGHLSRTRNAIEGASMVQLIGTLLGVAAAVGSGRSDVGQAVIMGSQSAGQRIFMKYSQTQESAADQAAMRLLEETERSARGLEGFLSQLGDQEILNPRLQDPYAQTHPLSRERIDTLRAYIATSPYSDKPPSNEDVEAHAIMVAKLFAFINPFIQTMRKYPETDQSFAARYARVIAHYRKPDLKTALPLLDELIHEMPRNPFLLELKGQMLFEHARPQEALEAYRKSYELLPDEPLIIMELARVELEVGTPELIDQSIEHLSIAHHLGAANAFSWRQLGIAYGRKGEMGLSSLALAESEYRTGQLANAQYHAGRAVSLLKTGSREHLQAQDLEEAIKVAMARRAAAKK